MESMQIKDNNRLRTLSSYLDTVEKYYGKGCVTLPAVDRDIIEKIEQNKGEISGRTALITEIVLMKNVERLKNRNTEILRTLNSAEDFNRANLEEELDKNNDEINMIESNCLKSLGGINKNL